MEQAEFAVYTPSKIPEMLRLFDILNINTYKIMTVDEHSMAVSLYCKDKELIILNPTEREICGYASSMLLVEDPWLIDS